MGQPSPNQFSVADGITGGFGAAALYPNLFVGSGSIMFTPAIMPAVKEQHYSRREAVRQTRAAERKSESIRGGIHRRTDMVVGTNLRVHPQPNWDLLDPDNKVDGKARKAFTKQCRNLFYEWGYDGRMLCDGEGHYNFGGLMWLAFRSFCGPDAETVMTIPYDQQRADGYNHNWATYVSLIDPDRLQTPAEFATDPNVVEGRREDRDGRMLGLYLVDQRSYEGSTAAPLQSWTYVPRETDVGRAMAVQFFLKTRPGQRRGLSSLVSILKQDSMLGTFDDAYLGAAIVNQALSTYVETLASAETVAEQMAPAAGIDGDLGLSPWDRKLGYYGQAKLSIGGARVPVMPPGDKIIMNAVDRMIQDPSGFRNAVLRPVASATGVSFEQLAMNFSETNYSSARAALLEVWRGVIATRQLFTGHVASLIYAAVMEEAWSKLRLTLPAGTPDFLEMRTAWTGCAWTGPGMGWIDPQKEANAMETLLGLNVISRSRIAAQQGEEISQIFEELSDEQEDASELELDLTLPAQMVNNPPAAQPADPKGPADPTDPKSGPAKPAPAK